MTVRRRLPPIFLDRDGTIIVEKHYLSDPDEVFLETSVIEGLSVLQAAGHPLIVVSNQSGVARGFFTEADALRVNRRADELLRANGVEILGWYLCIHGPADGCDCRKPLPGMAVAAARDLDLQLRGSYVIGDKRADIELADAIGGTGVLVSTGHGKRDGSWAEENGRPVVIGLREAASYISEREATILNSPSGRGT